MVSPRLFVLASAAVTKEPKTALRPVSDYRTSGELCDRPRSSSGGGGPLDVQSNCLRIDGGFVEPVLPSLVIVAWSKKKAGSLPFEDPDLSRRLGD